MPKPPQVTLQLAQLLQANNQQFVIRLVPEKNAHPWSLFWHPDNNDEVLTSAGTRHLRLTYLQGYERAFRKLTKEGWQYAPWTLSNPQGVPGLANTDDLTLTPLNEAPYNQIRRFIWKGLDEVDARDENDDLVITLTEFGARMLSGRLMCAGLSSRLRFEPPI